MKRVDTIYVKTVLRLLHDLKSSRDEFAAVSRVSARKSPPDLAGRGAVLADTRLAVHRN